MPLLLAFAVALHILFLRAGFPLLQWPYGHMHVASIHGGPITGHHQLPLLAFHMDTRAHCPSSKPAAAAACIRLYVPLLASPHVIYHFLISLHFGSHVNKPIPYTHTALPQQTCSRLPRSARASLQTAALRQRTAALF